jgi:peroxiredoxin
MKALLMIAGLIAAIGVSAETKPLAVGQSIPDTKLETVEGEAFDLQTAAKEQPLVVIFYRGGWCPFCNRHLGQLQDAEPKLRELGYRIIAISPDRPSELAKSAEEGHLSYTLLSDSSMETAKAFGLAFTVDGATLEKYKGYGIDLEAASGEAHHMLPVPAVFLVGTNGVIEFVHANSDYKTRLAPEALLAAAKAVLPPGHNK